MDEPEERWRQELSDSVRRIVVSRERTPRDPRWAAAWRRTLFRYVDRLNQPPSHDREGDPPATGGRP